LPFTGSSDRTTPTFKREGIFVYSLSNEKRLLTEQRGEERSGESRAGGAKREMIKDKGHTL
jgi:hypothetical protein